MKKNNIDDDARMVTEEELRELMENQNFNDDNTIISYDGNNSDNNNDLAIDEDVVLDNEDNSDVDETVITSSNNDKVSKKKNKKIVDDKNFDRKFFLHAFLVILFSFLAAFFIKRSFARVDEQNITYQENSNLDYKVYLKNNDFYDDDYLKKDMVYVASLIDKIDVDFDYIFRIDKKSDIDFEYDIIGKLIISDTNNKNVFFEKEYVLLENTLDSMREDGLHEIKKNISIDYGQYNNLANQFRSKYGVDTNSRLVVYLNIREKSKDSVSFNNNSNMSLTIPLSLKAINITMDYSEVNKTSKLVRNSEFVITNYLFLVLGCLFVVGLVVVLIKFIILILSLRVKKTKYDRYINRLLREYDRLIVETVTKPVVDNKNVVEILRFQELLDVRDNLKLPIKYYIVKNHRECYFYINHEEELYLFRVLADDMNEDR